jgi:hypothetical protein
LGVTRRGATRLLRSVRWQPEQAEEHSFGIVARWAATLGAMERWAAARWCGGAMGGDAMGGAWCGGVRIRSAAG